MRTMPVAALALGPGIGAFSVPLRGTFELVVGSDLLYEDQHVELLATFIDQHSKPAIEVIIVDLGRGRCGKFTHKMTPLGYFHSQHQPGTLQFLAKPFKDRVFHYSRQCPVS